MCVQEEVVNLGGEPRGGLLMFECDGEGGGLSGGRSHGRGWRRMAMESALFSAVARRTWAASNGAMSVADIGSGLTLTLNPNPEP